MTMGVDETKTHMDDEKKKPIKNNSSSIINDDDKSTDESLLSEEDQSSSSSTSSSSPRGVFEIPITDSNSSSSSSSTVFDNNSQHEEQTNNNTTTDEVVVVVSSDEKPIIQKSLINSNTGSFKGLMETVRKNSSLSMRRFSTSTIALLTSIDLSKRTSRNNKRLTTTAQVETEEAEEEKNENHHYSAAGNGILVQPPPNAKPSWRNFRYIELASASNNFSPERLLGKGGHAEVYEGKLADGTVVAIKKLMKKKGANDKEEDERVADFLSELGIIAHVDHHNTAKLIGFGVERGLFIVLQHCPRGSLASHLHGSNEGLMNWNLRYKVAIGVAKGLNFLHHGCHRRIIHRDIKASNILLSEDFEPLISDFGLAKWLPNNWLHHVVHPIEGTFGYLAPEYFMHGIIHEKTDVFAFGVLLLELLTGRHAVDSTRQSLVMWAKPLLDRNKVDELIDPIMLGTESYDEVQVRRVMVTASMCIHHDPAERPYMKRVVELLEEESMNMMMMVQQQKKRVSIRSMLIDACDLEDYTCSKYLKDLNRHRQLVME